MSNHIKKIIAPVVIVVIIMLYTAAVCALALFESASVFSIIIGIGIPAAVFGVSVFVLVERINEIRSGEEDDLSKY